MSNIIGKKGNPAKQKARRNGVNGTDQPAQMGGLSGMPGMDAGDPFENWLSGINGQSPGKAFIEPGDDPQNLLMRTVFKHTEPPDLRLAVRFLQRCERYSDERHKEMLMNLLAGAVSVDGRSMLLYLQSQTNLLATNVLERMIGGPGSNSSGKSKGNGHHSGYIQSDEEEA